MAFPESNVLPETKIGLDDVPEISRHFRLQFEQAQSAGSKVEQISVGAKS